MFINTNSVTLCQNSLLQNFGDVKNEVFEKKIAFFFCLVYVEEIETEKRKTNKMEKAPKPYNNRFFKVVIQKCEKSKKMDFQQKLPDAICVMKGEKNAHFRAHYLFWPKFFLDQNSVNQEKQ